MSRILHAAEHVARVSLGLRGFSSRWVEGRNGRLHVYESEGRGTLPTMVVLHGLGSGGAGFAPLFLRLRKHARRIVVPELPGHGFSALPSPARLSPVVLAECVVDALDQVAPEPAIVVGNSLGGAMALRYATLRPDRVAALVLISPAGARVSEEEWRALLASFELRGTRDALRFIERVYHRTPWFMQLVAREFPRLFARPAVRDILETATLDDSATPEELARLTMPILLVWGRSDRLLPGSALSWYRTHLPPHTVVVEPHGFGHSPHLDDPRRLARGIVEFATRATARPAAG